MSGPFRPDLAAELRRRAANDQHARGFALRGDRPTPEDIQRVLDVDADNTAWLERVIAEHGWPGFTLVGRDAAHHAWLIAQHCDERPQLQEQWLGLLRDAVENADADRSCLAYLEDRVAAHAGEPQRHGTQWTVRDGRRRLAALADPARVNELRAASGLDALTGDDVSEALLP